MNVFILQKPTEILLKTSQNNIGFKDFRLQTHIGCMQCRCISQTKMVHLTESVTTTARRPVIGF